MHQPPRGYSNSAYLAVGCRQALSTSQSEAARHCEQALRSTQGMAELETALAQKPPSPSPSAIEDRVQARLAELQEQQVRRAHVQGLNDLGLPACSHKVTPLTCLLVLLHSYIQVRMVTLELAGSIDAVEAGSTSKSDTPGPLMRAAACS